jgi:hypothetical protein
MVAIVANMSDQAPSGPASAADGAVAVAKLESMSADLRGCVILAGDGSVLAASGDHEPWGEAARAMLAAADSAAGEPVNQAHVGTEDGEAFAIRHAGYSIVAAAERFALASLMFFDMRAVLRELAAAAELGAPAARAA